MNDDLRKERKICKIVVACILRYPKDTPHLVS